MISYGAARFSAKARGWRGLHMAAPVLRAHNWNLTQPFFFFGFNYVSTSKLEMNQQNQTIKTPPKKKRNQTLKGRIE